MRHLVHLARRFFGSLRAGGPLTADVAWVHGHLSVSEYAIWEQMSDPDRRHSVEVAHAVDAEVADLDRLNPDWSPLTASSAGSSSTAASFTGFDGVDQRRRVMVAAALLHDSGKNASRLGTMARVGATITRPMLASDTILRWAEDDGFRQRLAWYWRHPELGSAALVSAGSHPLVARWAAEHHQPPDRWSVPRELGDILSRCDND